MIRVALVDDHTILRKSLAQMLERLPGFRIVLQAGNGRELINRLQQSDTYPDIVVTDIAMPCMDGIETTRWLQQRYPQIKVVALTMLTDKPLIAKMRGCGVRGYLLKDSDPPDLQAALLEVHYNGYYYNELLSPEANMGHAKKERGLLSEQELIFLRWACTEKTHKEIAAEMCVSPRTIDGYRDAVFRKLKVSSRVGMVLYALKSGIVVL